MLTLLIGIPIAGTAPLLPTAAPLTVHHVAIELRPEALASLRSDPRHYIRANVKLDAQTLRDVGLRLKGSVGSFRPIDDQPGITMDLGRFVPAQTSPIGAKVHLNNSVEDPSHLQAVLGGEIFHTAGVPTPRSTPALVHLNGRRLGLYVLQEGFTEAFLAREFGRGDGALFDTDDLAPGLAPLLAAAAEADPNLRWERLGDQLELDRFLTFLALEVLLCHHDGYAIARNNFHIYQAPDTHKFHFLPHGMDQLFSQADFPWVPQMNGPVAAAVLSTPLGRRQYEARFAALFTNVFILPTLTNRVGSWTVALRPWLTPAEFVVQQQESAALVDRLRQRHAFLATQLREARPTASSFEPDVTPLSGWIPMDVPEHGALDRVNLPGIGPALHIVAGPRTAAAWQCKVRLPPGRYRFSGRIRTVAAVGLPFVRHPGAGLRLGGQERTAGNLLGTTPWQAQEREFEVTGAIAEVLVLCEFYGSHGEAWFDQSSLRIAKIP